MWPFIKKPEEPKKLWRYVGEVSDTYTMREGTLTIDKFKASVRYVYFMTDEGERKFKIILPELDGFHKVSKASTSYSDAMVWQQGGPFPKDFEPVDDVLGEMLTRLIDRKLVKTKVAGE